MRKTMKIKKNDTVLVTVGKDKGKKSKVTKVLPQVEKIVVEGVNIAKKHTRPRKQGEKGQRVEVAMPLHISKVKLVCPKCEKPTRVGYKVTEKDKFRICKKCKQEI